MNLLVAALAPVVVLALGVACGLALVKGLDSYR